MLAEHKINHQHAEDVNQKQSVKQYNTQYIELHIIEKVLYIAMIVAIFTLIILLLNAKNDASVIREKIHDVEYKSEELQAQNSAIKADIDHETSYQSMQQKTKSYGMKQDMSNVYHIRK